MRARFSAADQREDQALFGEYFHQHLIGQNLAVHKRSVKVEECEFGQNHVPGIADLSDRGRAVAPGSSKTRARIPARVSVSSLQARR